MQILSALLSAIIFLLHSTSHAERPIDVKSRAALGYSLGFAPAVSRIIGDEGVVKLSQLHRISLEVNIPYNRYLTYGFAFDFTQVISSVRRDPRLDLTNRDSPIATTLLGLSFLLKPQLPLTIKNTDVMLYAQAVLGLGGSTPITMGTQPLSNYRYQDTRDIPTPFPLYFESSPGLGFDVFFSDTFGVGLLGGYRMLWVVHPMVFPEKTRDRPSVEDRSALWYDISSFYAQVMLKLAF